jgi:mortality factor 4-like protein 1
MGSSSNTNTSGGASDKEEKKKEDKIKGKDSSGPSFKENERVLAYHGPLLYEAKVRYFFPSLPGRPLTEW